MRLALVPARGGSKGLLRKNILPLAGKPLIGWTIEHALAAASIDRVIVSTEDTEIADIARAAGADVPFLRPAQLAGDDTPDLPVLAHALAWIAEHEGLDPDVVAWLRPTSPLRTAGDVDAAVALLETRAARCVRSVCLAEHHPAWMYALKDEELEPLEFPGGPYLRRQDLPAMYRPNGAVDVIRRDAVPGDGPLFATPALGYVMPRERSVDIDDAVDLELAALLLRRMQA
jgi:CMP-N-acetylneuraminic acid synthetase